MVDLCARRATARSTGTCSASAPAGNHEHQLAASTRGRRAGRTRRRAHDPAVDAHPAVVPLRLRPRRPARLARGHRHPGRRAPPAPRRPRGARPARRAGALGGGRRARQPRALGAASAIAETFTAETQRVRGPHGRRHRDGTAAWRRSTRCSTSSSPTACAPGCGPSSPAEDDATWQARADVWRDPRAVIGALRRRRAPRHVLHGAAYSTFLVGAAVRDLGLLGIEEAVRLLTDVPGAALRPRRTAAGSSRARTPTSCVRPAHRRPGRRAHPRRPPRRREPDRRRERRAWSTCSWTAPRSSPTATFTGATPGTVLRRRD